MTLPKEPNELYEQMKGEIASVTDALAAGEITVAVWQAEMEGIIARYNLAAYMVGQGGPVLDEEALTVVIDMITEHLNYLDNFAIVMQEADEFLDGWRERAQQYANSVTAPYWKGAVKVLPVPAVPGDGSTICGYSCKCTLDVEVVDAEMGDYDVYWRLDESIAPERHCSTCLSRARVWSPLQIRGGKLQGGML